VKAIKPFGLFWLATLLLTVQATAHGGVTMVLNRCIMRIGPYLMSFNGYQPDRRSYKPFCDDIPDVGRTLIVLDVEQVSGGSGFEPVNFNDLREMDIDFRVLRDVGQASDEENLEQNTEAYLAPRKYPSGTLQFEHNFTEQGKFIGLVSARDDHGRVFVSRFPFTVGPTFGASWYLLGAAGLTGAALVIYFVFIRRRMASG
jgi:hypothetical protein